MGFLWSVGAVCCNSSVGSRKSSEAMCSLSVYSAFIRHPVAQAAFSKTVFIEAFLFMLRGGRSALASPCWIWSICLHRKTLCVSICVSAGLIGGTWKAFIFMTASCLVIVAFLPLRFRSTGRIKHTLIYIYLKKTINKKPSTTDRIVFYENVFDLVGGVRGWSKTLTRGPLLPSTPGFPGGPGSPYRKIIWLVLQSDTPFIQHND